MFLRSIPAILALACCGAPGEELAPDAQEPTDAPARTAVVPFAPRSTEPDHPTRPLVQGIVAHAAADGTVPLAITVLDATSPTVDLMLYVSCDAAAWSPATTRDPLTALAAAPTGVTHTIRWDAGADAGLHAHACRVAAVAIDPDGLSSEPVVTTIALADPQPGTR